MIISTCMQLHSIAESAPPEADRARMSEAVRVALFVFLITSWFLSRTYVVTLYLLLGIAGALIAHTSDATEEEAYPRVRWLQATVFSVVASVIAAYGFVRVKNL
jgi:hypothetical protein